MPDNNVKYYLAIDIGASSGRHILTHMENGRMICEEVYRFYNGNDLLVTGEDGIRFNAGPADGNPLAGGGHTAHRIWNLERLFAGVVTGMKKCAELGKVPVSFSIDTWAIDYVLLDDMGHLTAPCYAYRDRRTNGMDREVSKIIPEKDLYARTGIQKAIFNTIYQLMAAKRQEPQTLQQADCLLMIPDYLGYLLTGVKCQEYTNASTTQLMNPVTKEWDYGLIEMLGLPKRLFGKISMPGTVVGDLTEAVRDEIGYDSTLILAATHDTGSAVMSVPSDAQDILYISSGTWSLLGCERKEADCGRAAQAANFTNEGGYDYRFRFLKNIMGLWMIQSVQKELQGAAAESDAEPSGAADSLAEGSFRPAAADSVSVRMESAAGGTVRLDADRDFSFGHLCDRAALETIDSIVDANDGRFLAPVSMVREIQNACRESHQEVPESPWALARVIYRSLAECYRQAIAQLEDITGSHYETINIVGGGSNARWLNELTADVTGRRVLAGPSEATAIGCLGAQMIRDGTFADLAAFRRCVYTSFGVQEYTPGR